MAERAKLLFARALAAGGAACVVTTLVLWTGEYGYNFLTALYYASNVAVAIPGLVFFVSAVPGFAGKPYLFIFRLSDDSQFTVDVDSRSSQQAANTLLGFRLSLRH